ncbi:MAG: hypothetical protein ACYC3I_26180 [Gemmataceae bacterium]
MRNAEHGMWTKKALFVLCLVPCVLCFGLAGCSFPQCLYFLMPEAKDPAELKRLAGEDGKKEAKVVLWAYTTNFNPGEEFIQADRHLAKYLAEEIHRLTEANGEKVTVVKPNQVEQYKSKHPDWQSFELAKVCHDFDADYVINLEIGKLLLYEPATNQQLYRGQAEIQVSVLDKKHPDDVLSKEFNDRYPNEAHGSTSTFDEPWQTFREKFLHHLSKRLAFYFVNHQKRTKEVDMGD